jgi:hypothetical protein
MDLYLKISVLKIFPYVILMLMLSWSPEKKNVELICQPNSKGLFGRVYKLVSGPALLLGSIVLYTLKIKTL